MWFYDFVVTVGLVIQNKQQSSDRVCDSHIPMSLLTTDLVTYILTFFRLNKMSTWVAVQC